MLKFVRENQISSFGPDAGAACAIFTDDGCTTTAGAHATVRYPGIADLSSVRSVGSWQLYLLSGVEGECWLMGRSLDV